MRHRAKKAWRDAAEIEAPALREAGDLEGGGRLLDIVAREILHVGERPFAARLARQAAVGRARERGACIAHRRGDGEEAREDGPHYAPEDDQHAD